MGGKKGELMGLGRRLKTDKQRELGLLKFVFEAIEFADGAARPGPS